MSESFAPGIDRPGGGKAERAPYPPGPAGVRVSIDKVCKKIVEARFDRDVQGWGKDVLKKRGLDGRDGATSAQIMAGILDEIRQVTVYVSDAYGAEVIQSASATLCLRPGLCIRGGDCDDLVVVTGGVLMALGIRVWVVKQMWHHADQEHVLVAGEDEDGRKVFLDPSTRLGAGSKYPADEVVFFDPMTVAGAGPEIVTLGGLPLGRVNASRVGVGAVSPAGAAARFAHSVADLAALQSSVFAGDMYLQGGEFGSAVGAYQAAGQAGVTTVGPEIDLAGAPNTTQPITQQAWTINGQLAAIGASSPVLADATRAQGFAKQMLELYQQAIAAGTVALSKGADPAPGPTSAPSNVLLATLGLGAIAGVAIAVVMRRRGEIQVRRDRPVRARRRLAA